MKYHFSLPITDFLCYFFFWFYMKKRNLSRESTQIPIKIQLFEKNTGKKSFCAIMVDCSLIFKKRMVSSWWKQRKAGWPQWSTQKSRASSTAEKKSLFCQNGKHFADRSPSVNFNFTKRRYHVHSVVAFFGISFWKVRSSSEEKDVASCFFLFDVIK